MPTERSETHVEKADFADHVLGNVGENGERLENGHPVEVTETETETETDDDD